MRVAWRESARLDLRLIVGSLAHEDPGAASRIRDRIRERVAILGKFPWYGRPGRLPDTRELVIARTPYIVAYRVELGRDLVHVIGIRHGAQQWPGEF